MAEKQQENGNPTTVITLTLPTTDDNALLPETVAATLLIQRGDLAQICQFEHTGSLVDLMDAISEALEALEDIESNPPVIPDLPKEKPKKKSKRKAQAETVDDGEPTIDVPLKKGTQAVKMSHIKIVSGDSDAAAYRQATILAGRLIDGKLWDGETAIHFENVSEVTKKMKHLTEKDLSLFDLTDFVQLATATEKVSTDEIPSEQESQAQATLL